MWYIYTWQRMRFYDAHSVFESFLTVREYHVDMQRIICSTLDCGMDLSEFDTWG